MNRDESNRLKRAMDPVRSIETQLAIIQQNWRQTDSERDFELIDDLITHQMGIASLRRKHATTDSENGKTDGLERLTTTPADQTHSLASLRDLILDYAETQRRRSVCILNYETLTITPASGK